jgi:hypothetical protein
MDDRRRQNKNRLRGRDQYSCPSHCQRPFPLYCLHPLLHGHLKCTPMIGDAFFQKIASSMVSNSTHRGHSLTMETAVRILKSSGFYDASTCAKCKHYVIPASNLGQNKLSPQRPDPTSGYDRQACLLSYCLGCQRLCVERSPDEEEKLHEFIRWHIPPTNLHTSEPERWRR